MVKSFAVKILLAGVLAGATIISPASAANFDSYRHLKDFPPTAFCGLFGVDLVDDFGGALVDATYHLTDDGHTLHDLPFAFPFFDREFTRIGISNNGGIFLLDDSAVTPPDISARNSALPNSQSAAYGIFPFWDDIDSETGAVVVSFSSSFNNGNGESESYVAIQWNKRPHFNNIGEGLFTLYLWRNGNIGFTYEDIDFGSVSFDGGASATVGIQGLFQGRLITQQISFNTVLDHNRSCFFPIEAGSGSGLDFLPAILSGIPE